MLVDESLESEKRVEFLKSAQAASPVRRTSVAPEFRDRLLAEAAVVAGSKKRSPVAPMETMPVSEPRNAVLYA